MAFKLYNLAAGIPTEEPAPIFQPPSKLETDRIKKWSAPTQGKAVGTQKLMPYVRISTIVAMQALSSQPYATLLSSRLGRFFWFFWFFRFSGVVTVLLTPIPHLFDLWCCHEFIHLWSRDPNISVQVGELRLWSSEDLFASPRAISVVHCR